MTRMIPVFALLVLIAGCSAILLTEAGDMKWLGNERYGYRLIVPSEWELEANSKVRPTFIKFKAPKHDAAIVIWVDEGGEAPDMVKFAELLEKKAGAEFLTTIRNWRVVFNDYTGYTVNFHWKGKIAFGKIAAGKPGVEYQATLAVVNRQPSPIYLICYSKKSEFERLNHELFAEVRQTLSVMPVEITVRTAPKIQLFKTQ